MNLHCLQERFPFIASLVKTPEYVSNFLRSSQQKLEVNHFMRPY